MPTWRRTNSVGDWAIVNVQSSAYGTAAGGRCWVNVAVVSEPWLRWTYDAQGKPRPARLAVSHGLYFRRLTTQPGMSGWDVSDEHTARGAVADMVAQLHTVGFPELDRLMAPGGMLRQVRTGTLWPMTRPAYPALFARLEAVLLMDAGPSLELDACLRAASEHGSANAARRFDTWVRAQAARAA